MSEARTLSTLQKPKVYVIDPIIPNDLGMQTGAQTKKRVAAYARVSTELEEQQNSYEAQLRYYTTYIHTNPDWEFVKVYADEGISGTSMKHRDGLNQLIADAEAGKIDLILTKSISRLSRNTVDALTITRNLKRCNVEVRFEKENISSFDSSAELLFTLLSSVAQEESRSISENVKWGHQRRMEQGKTHVGFKRFLGYDKGENGEWVINEKEAAVVRDIYDQFLNGKSFRWIVEHLEEKKAKAPSGSTIWHVSTIRNILTNEKYKGDARLQKTYVSDFLTKEVKKNHGERKQYYVKGHHPAIIEPERFDLVQREMARRTKHQRQLSNNSPFTAHIVCGDCGTFYGHKVHHGKDVWYCNHKYKNPEKCQSPMFHQEELEGFFCQALGQELTQIKAGNRPKPLSPDKEAKLTDKLRKARDRAYDTLDAEMESFQQRQASLSDAEYDAGTKHIADLEQALQAAEDAIVANAARKENYRRFTEATAEIDPESIAYSDDLFTATIELINVKKVRTGDYQLEFTFTNGQKVVVEK